MMQVPLRQPGDGIWKQALGPDRGRLRRVRIDIYVYIYIYRGHIVIKVLVLVIRLILIANIIAIITNVILRNGSKNLH